jgi:hypothetical protein
MFLMTPPIQSFASDERQMDKMCITKSLIGVLDNIAGQVLEIMCNIMVDTLPGHLGSCSGTLNPLSPEKCNEFVVFIDSEI